MKTLFSIPKAAALSGISYKELTRLVHENRIRTVSVPGRKTKLIDINDLARTIETWKEGPPVAGAEIGAIEKPRIVQVRETLGQKKQTHARPKLVATSGKYEWMERFTAK